MANAPLKKCSRVGCNTLTRNGRCGQHAREPRQEQPRASAASRGYDRRWRKLRAAYIAQYPLCVACESKGKVTAAVDVDHVVPHRGDDALRLAWDNMQSLCKCCHARKTRVGE